MKLGIMQPYFFPYLGYYSIINYTDFLILFDSVQYIRHGWINRNRILKPETGWQYIIVPLEKHSRETLIKEIKISNNSDWKNKILRQLEHYKKQAPFFLDTMHLLNDIFQFEANDITQFNLHILKKTCEYINIPFNFRIFSDMNMDLEEIENPGDWAYCISMNLGVKEYINSPGGENMFDKKRFDIAGIKLKFLELESVEYNQRRESFEPDLSIIDVLMFNNPDEIIKLVNRYQFL